MAEITDYGNSYLLSSSWQAHLPVGRRERSGGALPQRLSPCANDLSTVAASRFAKMLRWLDGKLTQQLHLLNNFCLKNQQIVATLTSSWAGRQGFPSPAPLMAYEPANPTPREPSKPHGQNSGTSSTPEGESVYVQRRGRVCWRDTWGHPEPNRVR